MERELLLLGLLRQQDMHGYQLAEFINRDLAYCTDLKKPTAYFLLNKMTEAGWIRREIVEQSSRPDRQVYRITPEGEAAFQQMLRANLSSYDPARFANDVGLAFLDALPRAEARDHLLRRRPSLAAALEQARAAPAHSGSLHLVIEHQQRHLASELEWLDEVITRLSD